MKVCTLDDEQLVLTTTLWSQMLNDGWKDNFLSSFKEQGFLTLDWPYFVFELVLTLLQCALFKVHRVFDRKEKQLKTEENSRQFKKQMIYCSSRVYDLKKQKKRFKVGRKR